MIGPLEVAFSDALKRRGDVLSTIKMFYELRRQQEIPFMKSLMKSKSQLGQDLFVLSELGFKKNGFFVEFGAANGVDLSNTYFLEKEFRWGGILSEPATIWHEQLRSSRSCWIDTNCVWGISGQTLDFNETSVAELSTVDKYSSADLHREARKGGRRYKVPTISLNDLLARYDAPPVVDYLSIDTEGSEFEILSAFDFSRTKIRVITCEHNYTSMREKIFDLLSGHGYVRKHEPLSKFDDWYVLSEV